MGRVSINSDHWSFWINLSRYILDMLKGVLHLLLQKSSKISMFLSYWSKNNILTVLIYNLKTAWPTKISMPFLSFLNIFYKMHNSFFKTLLISLR